MNCQHCSAHVDPDDHRCGRCGRRLKDESLRRPELPPVQRSAAAPQLHRLEKPATERPATGPRLIRTPAAASPGDATREAKQASLFGPMEITRGAARVMTANGELAQPMVPAPSARRRAASASAQQSLNFDITREAPRALPTSVRASVLCDAAAAPAMDRFCAAIIDVCIPAIGLVLFLAACYFTFGNNLPPVPMLPLGAAVFAAVTLFYRLLCVLGNTDTIGMSMAGLQLVRLDGRVPGRQIRFHRLLAGIVTLLSAGIGGLWSLLDEERLTWHDYISRAMPVRRS